MKRSIVVIISIVLVALVAAACSLPGYSQPAAQPTPNLTLTALFNTSLNIPATVTPIYIVVTNTPEPVTPTNTAAPTNTPEPTKTEEPTATATKTTAPAHPQPQQPQDYHASVMDAGFIDFEPDIDGSWAEWKDYTTQYPVNYVVYGANNWKGSDDLSASYAAVWDYDYLYVGVKVHDDVFAQIAEGADLYKGDSIEILLDKDLNGDYYNQSLSSDDYQLGISAGNKDEDIDPEAYLWFPTGKAGDKSNVDIGFTTEEDNIYRYEVRIPWSVFGITPSKGMRLGFAVSVSDNDKTDSKVQQSMVSSSPNRSLVNPMTWGILELDK